MIPVGLALAPDEVFLDLLAGALERDVDYFEVAPETLWRTDGAEQLLPNGFHRRFAALGARLGKPFVAHGVGLSVGTASAGDARRRRRWLARIAEDHASFRFLWYTDHLGWSSLDGLAMTLPLPIPMTASAAAVVRRRLRALQAVVPDVGVENTVTYFTLGDPLDEPAFLRDVLRAPRTHLLLDLHNVFTMAQNLGFDAGSYLARIDLGRVIEIHLSGGADSDPAWLPSGRTVRLDGHDDAVPEEVWRLYEHVAPRCPNLRGVTLERMEGTVGAREAKLVREELLRAKRLAARLPR